MLESGDSLLPSSGENSTKPNEEVIKTEIVETINDINKDIKPIEESTVVVEELLQPKEQFINEDLKQNEKKKFGLKIPTFFTKKLEKSKSIDGTEDQLLEDKTPKTETGPSFLDGLKKLFTKSPPSEPAATDIEVKEILNKSSEGINGEQNPKDLSMEEEKKDLEKELEKPKKNKFQSMKFPQLGTFIERFKKQSPDDIELGKGPLNRAGLASMETLDDSLKDQESKDTTDVKETEEVEKNNQNGDSSLKQSEKVDEKKEESIIQRVQNYTCSVDDLAIAIGILLFFLLVGIILAFTFLGTTKESKVAPVRDGKFVETDISCGKVEGILDDGAIAFRGIPYAKPPIGDLRFKPAQLINDIDYCWNGTFKAHNATPSCIQLYPGVDLADGSEDCLTLDVITPQVRYKNPFPVIVLIGTESLNGGSSKFLRPSNRYSRARDVIFVRPNFRLNALGFLALKSLSESAHPPTSGNYALSDIFAVLQWIQTNIRNFGGDPNSVTLVGHRAGSTLVTALTTSVEASKLFTRAWVSSGSAVYPEKSLDEAERSNKLYEDKLNCTTNTCLQTLEVESLVNEIPATWASNDLLGLPTNDENTKERHEWLVLDGHILKKSPLEVMKNQVQKTPKLVMGTTAHESHSENLMALHKEWTEEVIRKYVNDSIIGKLNLTEEALKRYGTTYQGLVSMISDIRTVCPLLNLAKLQNVPFYCVTQTGGALNVADVNSDVQAILGRYEPKTPEERRYVQSIQALFYHYVSHGSIKAFSQQKPVLDIQQDVNPKAEYPNCDFWISNNIVPQYAKID